MSITTDEVEKRLYASAASGGKIVIRVPVRWFGSICLPDSQGEHEIIAEFKILTFSDHVELERVCSYPVSFMGPWGREYESTATDRDEFRRLLIRRCLRKWNLPIPIEVDCGWITKECWEHIGRLPAPLLDHFVYKFQETFEIGEDESAEIDKQAAILFAKNSKGVSVPCEAVALYCTRSAMWDKFGLKEKELDGLSYRDYLRLRVLSSKDNEMQRKNRPKSNASNTRIAGPGGTRASRSRSMGG